MIHNSNLCWHCSLITFVNTNRHIGGAQIEPGIDAVQNINDFSIEHVNGVTTMRFWRPRTATDIRNINDEDLSSVTDCHYIIMAWGGTVTYANPNVIGYHGFSNREVSAVEYCFPDDCSPGD